MKIFRIWRSALIALSISSHAAYIQKNRTTRGKLQFLQECRVHSSGFVPTRESVRFGYLTGYCRSSDVDPTVTTVVGFYEASFAQDNTKIASESEGFRNERCAMVSPRKTRTTPMCSTGFKGREGELLIRWKREGSISRREKIDGTFLCSAQYRRSTAGIFQPRPFIKNKKKINVI